MAAATAAAVVAEEDTELRDLLVQTLENSGVLNRIKVRRGPGSWRAAAGRARAPQGLCGRRRHKGARGATDGPPGLGSEPPATSRGSGVSHGEPQAVRL